MENVACNRIVAILAGGTTELRKTCTKRVMWAGVEAGVDQAGVTEVGLLRTHWERAVLERC